MLLLRFTLSLPVLLPLFLLLLLFLYASSGLSSLFTSVDFDPTPDEPFELFVLSAYYYRQSKSLGNNSVGLVLTGDFVILTRLQKVEVIGWSNETNAVADVEFQRVTPHNVCRWIAMIVTTPLLPGLERLALSVGNRLVDIPFREPALKRRDVVTCVAPLFGNEQWQQALFAAHVYRKFGSHMHLYVRSMVSPVFELMKVYEREGYLTLQPWLRLTLLTIPESEFNPNVNVEFRSQAAAQTDCLLQYKESASYIAFMDLDDVLIPRLAGTYLDEFTHLFHSMPNVAFLHYSKENTRLKAARTGGRFSMRAMLSTIQFEQHSETGKMVADPRYVNSTWIHYPIEAAEGMERYNVPNHVNAITHLKHMRVMDEEIQSGPLTAYKPQTYEQVSDQPLLSSSDIDDIQLDFERMAAKAEVASILPRLPTSFPYLKAIAKCFEDTYYKFHYSGRTGEITCPGPDRCLFPRGIPCYNSVANFQATTNGTKLNLHYAMDASFMEESGCKP
ncbi:hypothetical protein Q1695_008876 [Nippostrongylus brasiliensis]|nr:hypothetical protein Q1695_008876 [Nippostrongylus brasiliensis]